MRAINLKVGLKNFNRAVEIIANMHCYVPSSTQLIAVLFQNRMYNFNFHYLEMSCSLSFLCPGAYNIKG